MECDKPEKRQLPSGTCLKISLGGKTCTIDDHKCKLIK